MNQSISANRTRVIALAAAILVSMLSCGSEKESDTIMPDTDINTVMEAHVDGLMAIPGVTGVAVGETENGTPCILVLVVEETEEINQKIPDQLEGHPVRLMVSGEIKPMKDN